MELLSLFALILLNGFFAMSEIALIMSRRSRLVPLAEEGDNSAKVALALHDDPTRLLSTVQIGITSIGILSGIFGEAALAAPLGAWLQSLGMSQNASELLATALVVLVITYFAIVIGELVPKRLAQSNPERIARIVANPMRWLSIATRPFVRLLSWSTNAILGVFGQTDGDGQKVTEDEIHAILQGGSDSGAIEPEEHQMVRKVLGLDDRRVGSLMIPRSDIVYLDLNDSMPVLLRRVIDSKHSRFPLCRANLSQIVGITHTKTILAQSMKGHFELESSAQPATYVPETITGKELLEHFRTTNFQMALVVDEYGEIKGLVTLQDVLEALTGEFSDANPDNSWAIQRNDGSWLLDGIIPIPELEDTLGINVELSEHRQGYYTLAGFLLNLLGKLPKASDIVTWQDWHFEIVDMDGNRIDKVLAYRLAKNPKDPGPTG